ncbi:MAG: hypothetical protein JWQ36_817 [Enterovirga sp.]|nr:hypothetical protein [Enterovirga sp.]
MGLLTDSIARPSAAQGLRRLARLALDRCEAGTARRFAASAFLARIVNAGLGFVTQIVLARWMGEREYGLYAYVWVWLLLLGGIGSLGLPVAALKFVPDYRARGDVAGLRGFLRFVRGLALLPCILGAGAAMAFLLAIADGEGLAYLPVALIALAVLPLYVATDIQTGIARAYDFLDLGLSADYLVRPLLILGSAGLIWAAGGRASAVNVMAGTLAATALTALAQGVVLQKRLRARIPAGPIRTDFKRWRDAAWPLLAVTGFTLLLGSTDILVLQLFVGPEEIALYFAATKIVAIASFVSYGVANTSAHRFAEHVARGDAGRLSALAAETVRWTFWPTLAVAAVLALLAGPLLALFGPNFAQGAPIVAILGVGLVAGAAVGPADRALAMADHGRATAAIYAICFLANLVLALVLTPALGLAGAALATALAMAMRAAMLFMAARNRLGLTMFIMSRADAPAGSLASADAAGLSTALLSREEAERILAEWQDLAERALEPNPFYGPAMTLAGLRHLPEGAGARVIAAWRDEPGGRKLVGILPVTRPRGRQFNPFAFRRAAGFYGTLSTPLLDPVRPAETLRAMLAGLGQARVAALALPFLRRNGPVAAALAEACGSAGLRRITVDQHERPMVERGLPGADFARLTVEP